MVAKIKYFVKNVYVKLSPNMVVPLWSVAYHDLINFDLNFEWCQTYGNITI